jgi:hypothetical protein
MAMEVRCSRVEAVDVARLQLQVQAAPHFIHGGDADGLGRPGLDRMSSEETVVEGAGGGGSAMASSEAAALYAADSGPRGVGVSRL